MRLAVERYFGAIGHLLDETNYILTDWSTPMDKLVEQCDIRIYQRGFELGHYSLVHSVKPLMLRF